MTARFSFFSHLENLEHGSLEFGDPFEVGRTQPLMCRFELSRQSEQVLAPDTDFSGLARYHRLLPVDRKTPVPECTTGAWETNSATHHIPRPHQVLRMSPDLPFALPTALAAQQGLERIWCRGSVIEDLALVPLAKAAGLSLRLSLPRELAGGALPGLASPSELVFEGDPQPPEDLQADVGVWGNPFRAEGLKCLGLDVFNQFPDDSPALLYFDPHGELSYSLVLAAELIAQKFSGHLPFRPIAVQTHTRDFLCQAFETGGTLPVDIEEPRPHAKLVQATVRGMMALGGTCVRLDQAEPKHTDQLTQLLAQAHTRLARTLFVEDEDSLILLLPQ